MTAGSPETNNPNNSTDDAGVPEESAQEEMNDNSRNSSNEAGGGRGILSPRNLLLACLAVLIAILVIVAVFWSEWRSAQQQQQQQDEEEEFLTPAQLAGLTEEQFQVCDDTKYTKRTLRMVHDVPFQALFREINLKKQDTFEASDVFLLGEGEANASIFVVHDSSYAITKLNANLERLSDDNIQIGEPERVPEVDSDYEGLFYDSGIFYAVRESIQHENGEWHSIIEELELTANGTDYRVVDFCSTEMEFEGDWKGFEGAFSVRSLDNELIVFGLCEGNHCSEAEGRYDDKGNGKLVAMRKEIVNNNGTNSCQWSTIRQIDIPPAVFFTDYSAIALGEEGRIGITSQEDSKFWKGKMLGQNESTGLWDIDAMEFDPEEDKTYDFPRDHGCNIQYCNIEGVHWINKKMIVAVSDKMKSKGRQDFRCHDKDESVHIFVLP